MLFPAETRGLIEALSADSISAACNWLFPAETRGLIEARESYALPRSPVNVIPRGNAGPH